MSITHYKSEVFMNQFPIVKRFVYHLVYYRALSKQYSARQHHSEFWVLTIDAHLLQATIQWCMVFGADGTNPTHWKQLSAGDSALLQQRFRDGLSSRTGLTQDAWIQYWKQLTGFRNNFAAHRQLNYPDPVPDFDVALKVAYFYDVWIRQVIAPASFSEPSLSLFGAKLGRSSNSLASRLLDVAEKQS
jgi:hypothetical protein